MLHESHLQPFNLQMEKYNGWNLSGTMCPLITPLPPLSCLLCGKLCQLANDIIAKPRAERALGARLAVHSVALRRIFIRGRGEWGEERGGVGGVIGWMIHLSSQTRKEE